MAEPKIGGMIQLGNDTFYYAKDRGGRIKEPTAGQLQEFDQRRESTDYTVPGMDPIDRPGMGPVTRGNLAAGRPANVSAGDVASARRRQLQNERDAQEQALASRLEGMNLPDQVTAGLMEQGSARIGQEVTQDALRTDTLMQEEEKAQAARLLQEREQNMRQNRAATYADVLRSDLTGEGGASPYQTGAANLFGQGDFQGGKELLDMRRNLPGEISGVDIDGDGSPDVIQQGGSFKGTMPRQNQQGPTAKERQEQALIGAMEKGDWAMAARLMGQIEEPGRTVASPNIRRPATVDDARRYAQDLGLGAVQSPRRRETGEVSTPPAPEQNSSEQSPNRAPVRLRHPNGTLRDVPADQVQAALNAGYSQV